MFDFDAPPSKRVSLDATETWMTVDSTEDLDSFMFTTENDDDPILYQLQHQHPPFELLFMEASQTQEFQERKAQLEKCMRASRMSRQCLKKLTQTIQQRTKLLQVLNDIGKSTKIVQRHCLEVEPSASIDDELDEDDVVIDLDV